PSLGVTALSTPITTGTTVAFTLHIFSSSLSVLDANLIIKESVAKQLLRTKRQDRPKKAGYPDEPMREHLLHMQALDLRARETNLEHWLNPHCYPRCDRNYGHPV
uniref:Si:dkey-31g6.6 n=1 Tax=Astatotilapia calliptera TaxID=8154 RepID=A0AAX7T303_ASTCA